MVVFKQWHDEELNFYRQVKLYFSQCNMKEQIMLSEILALTSDTAVEDYHQQGMTFSMLLQNHFSILTSRVSFRFFEMPKTDQIITIKTWEEAPRGLQLSRGYIISDESGKILIQGISTWLVVNPETRRIVKPSLFTLRKEPTKTLELKTLDCGKIATPEDLTLLDQRKIRFTDIDANGHMNNSRYGNYIMDSLPKELVIKKFTDFRLNYAHEAMLDSLLDIYGKNDEEQKKITVIGKQGNDVCFESEIFYQD